MLWACKTGAENGSNQNCFSEVEQCFSNCSAGYQGSPERMQRFHTKKTA